MHCKHSCVRAARHPGAAYALKRDGPQATSPVLRRQPGGAAAAAHCQLSGAAIADQSRLLVFASIICSPQLGRRWALWSATPLTARSARGAHGR